jgi:hypothetical protein
MMLQDLRIAAFDDCSTLIVVREVIIRLAHAVVEALEADDVLSDFKYLRYLGLVIREDEAACADDIPDTKRNSASDVAHGEIYIYVAAPKNLRHIVCVVDRAAVIHADKALVVPVAVQIHACPCVACVSRCV